MMPKHIEYGTDLHRSVRDALLARYRFSKNEMQKRYDNWRRTEEKFLAYIPEKEADRLRRMQREQGTPQYTTIEIPYTYAVAMTAHTYWASVFLSKSPIFQFTARHGEPMNRVEAVEALIDYQVKNGGMQAVLYMWLLDAIKYGFGVVGQYWDEEQISVSRIEEIPELYMGVFDTGRKTKKRIVERVRGYTGNKLYNVRPYDFFPDPRVPIGQFQDGEYVGRYVEVGWNTVNKREQDKQYFNIDKLKMHRVRQINQREQGSNAITLPEAKQDILGPNWVDGKDMGYVSLIEMYVELVPKEWGLGDGSYPEKWAFVLAEEEIVVHASPLGMYHGKFPFAIQETEPDRYSITSRSMIETIAPMQDLLTWLLNTHLQNVRKVLNDMFVFDPSRVVMKDVVDPRPGKYIRLKPEAYGTDPRTAIHQFQVTDVTRQHVEDADRIMQLIQRVSGVTDNVMGMLNPTGRRTATESRISTNFSANRLKTSAEYMSATGWGPLAQLLVQSSQQLFDMQQQFRVVGDVSMGKPAFVDVDPSSIAGFYDFVPVEGTLPVDKFALASLWKELLMQIASAPPLAQQFDLSSIFSYTARLAGAKNVDQFKLQPGQIQPQIVPDAQAAANAKSGKSIPVNQAEIASAQGGAQNQPQQTPGMGRLM